MFVVQYGKAIIKILYIPFDDSMLNFKTKRKDKRKGKVIRNS